MQRLIKPVAMIEGREVYPIQSHVNTKLLIEWDENLFINPIPDITTFMFR